MVTCAGTGWPFRVAGSYWNCFKDSTAAGRNDGGPESTLIKLTSPAVPTTASITTLPVSKSLRASKEATARTDLINFGGTRTPSTPDDATGAAAFDAGWSVGRFPASIEEDDVFRTAGSTSELLEVGCAEGSVASLGSGELVVGKAALRADIPSEVTGASLATLALLKSELSAFGLPAAEELFPFAPLAGRLTDIFLAAGCHGSQCLNHAAPTAVTTRAVVSSARRKIPPRKLGVKLPLARNDLLRFGSDLLKSSAGCGNCACSSGDHWWSSEESPAGRELLMAASAWAGSDRRLAFTSVLSAPQAGDAEGASGTAAGGGSGATVGGGGAAGRLSTGDCTKRGCPLNTSTSC